MSKIMTMGEILVEIMATEVGQSFRQPGALAGPYPSGAPAIFIDQVAKLKQPCGIISSVGDDDFGALNMFRLSDDGVDISGISINKKVATGTAFVTYQKNGSRDFIFNITNSACAHLSLTPSATLLLKNCKHFHVMGSSLFSFRIIDEIKKAIEIVKDNGGTISFDPNIRKEMLKIPEMREALNFILEYTDIFLPSGADISMLTSATKEDEAIEEILDLGVREIALKRGRNGGSFYNRTEQISLPAFANSEIDPTGAGDCFGATFVVCRLQGMSAEDSLRYANASGALAVAHKGPMEGTSSFTELDSFINNTKVC
ncbi:tagatose kinase [Pseudoalteromonas carrageenovora]|uniref:tagatose kinase n=1 Tax=Pseudoalteromonas carrageenovora TaxID=227 RepID=UPI0026E3061E|nr:sugar kinase [Pseudoalteromonas carrageenovora]MDO6546639.1 sugar kinase [Pseudoalteromonas carrageenovora]MDO6830610.1 sugar kinase [Pseudoalteromonas carrageenovora]